MAKKFNYDDPKLNEEFNRIHSSLDLYIVSTEMPQNPRIGTMWYNPSTDELKIWSGKQFNSH